MIITRKKMYKPTGFHSIPHLIQKKSNECFCSSKDYYSQSKRTFYWSCMIDSEFERKLKEINFENVQGKYYWENRLGKNSNERFPNEFDHVFKNDEWYFLYGLDLHAGLGYSEKYVCFRFTAGEENAEIKVCKARTPP